MMNCDYAVPDLFNVSLMYCESSSLPFASVDLWLHHADVVILEDSIRQDIESQLQTACNRNIKHPRRACIVFMQTEVLENENIGASLILHTIHRPFVLITASNSPRCVPYEYFPFGRLHPTVEYLLRSTLLIRWYAKNPCIFAGHVDGKLAPLPLGPKFQFQSSAFDGEPKEEVKRRLVAAGAGDPRALFLSPSKERRISAAMWVPNTDRPHYLPHTGVRRVVERALHESGLPFNPARAEEPPPPSAASTPSVHGGAEETDAGGPVLGERYWVDDVRRDHEAYLRSLARARFVVSPPGAELDAHRTWEALALGAVPMVLRGPLDPLLAKLPVVMLAGVGQLGDELGEEALEARHAGLRAAAEGYDWIRTTGFWW
jgi:hypothetical protein